MSHETVQALAVGAAAAWLIFLALLAVHSMPRGMLNRRSVDCAAPNPNKNVRFMNREPLFMSSPKHVMSSAGTIWRTAAL
jgi:hypothetical protein